MPDKIWRLPVMWDGKGKTQVQKLIWEYLRKHGEFNYNCLVRLATVMFSVWWDNWSAYLKSMVEWEML